MTTANLCRCPLVASAHAPGLDAGEELGGTCLDLAVGRFTT